MFAPPENQDNSDESLRQRAEVRITPHGWRIPVEDIVDNSRLAYNAPTGVQRKIFVGNAADNYSLYSARRGIVREMRRMCSMSIKYHNRSKKMRSKDNIAHISRHTTLLSKN